MSGSDYELTFHLCTQLIAARERFFEVSRHQLVPEERAGRWSCGLWQRALETPQRMLGVLFVPRSKAIVKLCLIERNALLQLGNAPPAGRDSGGGLAISDRFLERRHYLLCRLECRKGGD